MSPTKGSQLSKIMNPSEHPNLDLIEQLWMDGLRATEIVQYLDEKGLPPLKVNALAKHGQRKWNPKLKVVVGDKNLSELQEIISEIESSGMSVGKVAFAKRTGWGWEKQDGVNTQVQRDTLAHTIEIIPNLAPEFERATIPPITINSKPSTGSSKPSNLHLAVSLPDMQIGYHRGPRGELTTTHDESAIDVAHQIMLHLEQEHGIDLIVNQGDNLDFPMFSSHRSAPGYLETTQLAIDRAGTEAAVQREISPEAKIVWLEGNHECLSDEALAITIDGLKHYTELNEGDLILSATDDLQPTWLPIEKIHVYDFEGELVQLGTNHSQVQLQVTPNHRVVGLSPNNGKWVEKYAEDYVTMLIPVATKLEDRNDIDLTDDEIRLAAWCLTDSYLTEHGYWRFYQSEEKVDRIRNILQSCNLSYNENKRIRNIEQICGKTLINKPQISYDISLRVEESKIVSKIIECKEYLPSWIYSASDRQIEIFVRELQITDGTSLSTPAFPLYCSRPIRFELQQLLITRGYGCSMKEYRPGHWRLNIVPNKLTSKLETKSTSKVPYSGKVWCVTVANGRFFTSFNGHPSLTGNCRLTNMLTDKIPALVGISRSGEEVPVISVPYLCKFDESGVDYLDGYPDAEYWASKNLRFVHGHLYSSTKGGTANKYLGGQVCTVGGHIHRQELLHSRSSDKSYSFFAGSAGCLCKTNGSIPSSSTGIKANGKQTSKPKTEDWTQGIFVIYYDPDSMDVSVEPVVIEDGRAIFRGIEFISTVDPDGKTITS